MLAGDIPGHRALRRPSLSKPSAIPPGVVGLAGLGVAGCSGRAGLPRPASRQASEVLDLWRILLVAGVAVGVLVAGLILWAVVRYRRPRGAGTGDLPVQTGANVALEVFYTVIPLAIVAVLFALTLRTQHRVTRLSAVPGVVVEVTGFQWGWRFRYPAQSVTLAGDANQPPTLVLPVDADVRLRLATVDVIHSFFVPAFFVKRDLIPGVDNQIEIHPTETGTYRGFCAEFCGLDHWRMSFDVRVVTPEAFEAFITEQQPAPGQPPSTGGPGGLRERAVLVR